MVLARTLVLAASLSASSAADVDDTALLQMNMNAKKIDSDLTFALPWKEECSAGWFQGGTFLWDSWHSTNGRRPKGAENVPPFSEAECKAKCIARADCDVAIHVDSTSRCVLERRDPVDAHKCNGNKDAKSFHKDKDGNWVTLCNHWYIGGTFLQDFGKQSRKTGNTGKTLDECKTLCDGNADCNVVIYVERWARCSLAQKPPSPDLCNTAGEGKSHSIGRKDVDKYLTGVWEQSSGTGTLYEGLLHLDFDGANKAWSAIKADCSAATPWSDFDVDIDGPYLGLVEKPKDMPWHQWLWNDAVLTADGKLQIQRARDGTHDGVWKGTWEFVKKGLHKCA